MKFALELEVPDEQAAVALRWLQSLPPGLTARFSRPKPGELTNFVETDSAELTAIEEKELLHELFGAWKSGVSGSGEEMVREIYEARQSDHRDVEL